jgi:uncharacterized membrane protein YtjA (UPF0391 family)
MSRLAAVVLRSNSTAAYSGIEVLFLQFNGVCRWFINLVREMVMLKYAIIFALISLVAGVFGFTGVAAGAAGIAKIAFGLFLILTVIFIVLAALGVGAAKKILK